jgi:hypothetical protein
MSIRRLSVLQWIGVLVAPFVWATQHVIGYGIVTARCGDGRVTRLAPSNTVWELALLGVATLLIVGAEAAAIRVFVATRGEDAEESRLHFFATAAVVANVLFVTIIVLDGFSSALEKACVGS